MSSMFTTVLNMSITASYAAIAIIIARLFLYRAPKIFSYALWTVLLFRLLCPFTFESSVSLMPVNSQPIPQDIVYVENPAIQTGIKVIDNTVNTSIKNSLPVNQIASVNPMGEVMELGSLIWIIGILFLLTYGIITFLNLKNRLSIATLVNHNIYETDRIETPFVLGFIKPKIYIPTNLSENEFNYIIKHELTHIKRYDYIIKLIAFIALSIHWFNPIIWFSYFLMSKDMEMSCDESVMKDFNEDIRSSYSKSLLSLSAKQSGILVPLSFGESNVKSRIKNVLNYKKPTLWVIVILIIIIIGIIFILGTNPMKNDNNELYEFRGVTGVYEGNLYFKSETIPETIQEEIVYLDFLYTIEKNYDKYDGFVISHGTDTMSYTSAALSYLIQNLDKPVIITGAQKPINADITDAKKNLLDSFRFAAEKDVCGVYLVFDGKAIVGTRARKVKSKSYSAFESINFPVAAIIDDSRITKYIRNDKFTESVKFYKDIFPSIFLLKLAPGMEPDVLDYIGEKYEGVVIESYGVGGLPFLDKRNFLEKLGHLTEKGKIIVIATQVMFEGSDMGIYEVGIKALKKYNVLQAYDMTIESAITKLMWIMAQTKDYDEIKEMFYTTVNEDILY